MSLDQDLILCTRCGQLGVVKLLLGEGEFVDAKDEEGETALHKAARQALESLCPFLSIQVWATQGDQGATWNRSGPRNSKQFRGDRDVTNGKRPT